MKIEDILIILQNRLITLTEARKSAVSAGDLERVVQIDGDLMSTVSTIETMKQTISTS
jgi:hypothetical protein